MDGIDAAPNIFCGPTLWVFYCSGEKRHCSDFDMSGRKVTLMSFRVIATLSTELAWFKKTVLLPWGIIATPNVFATELKQV